MDKKEEKIVANIFIRPAWSFRVVKGDLFSAPGDYALAHCVGADFWMSRGIAVRFKQKFGRVQELKQQNAKPGEMAVLKVDNRFVYHLVTKQRSTQKPKLSDLRKSLSAMKSHIKAHGVRKVAIPRLGCGLDKLNWEDVYPVIERAFSKLAIEMVVYEK